MSAWSEAVYVIKEMRKTLISAELLEKLKERHNVIANLASDGDQYYPEGHITDRYSEEALWLITDENDFSGDYILSVIDSKDIIDKDIIVPSHKLPTDEYLANSIWLITKT